MNQKRYLQLSFFLLALSVALGAMGAHALEKSISPKALATFHTGIRYFTYHSLAILLIASSKNLLLNLKWAKRLIFLGMIFFSGNCILYALTEVKTFAMLVPIGGFSFIFGWIAAIIEIKEIK